MLTRSLALISILGAGGAACSSSTDKNEPTSFPGEIEEPADLETSTTAADGALATLKADLVADPDFAADAGVTAASTIDISLTKLFVRADELRAWTSGTAVGTLFHAIGMRLFLVLDGREVISALLMGKNPDGTWRVVSSGHAKHAPRIAAARASSIAQLGTPDRPMFLVEVPALYAEFISQRTDDGLFLTPTLDVAGLKAGTAVKAEDAIAALQALPPRELNGTRP